MWSTNFATVAKWSVSPVEKKSFGAGGFRPLLNTQAFRTFRSNMSSSSKSEVRSIICLVSCQCGRPEDGGKIAISKPCNVDIRRGWMFDPRTWILASTSFQQRKGFHLNLANYYPAFFRGCFGGNPTT